jgi:hypothetical protein
MEGAHVTLLYPIKIVVVTRILRKGRAFKSGPVQICNLFLMPSKERKPRRKSARQQAVEKLRLKKKELKKALREVDRDLRSFGVATRKRKRTTDGNK